MKFTILSSYINKNKIFLTKQNSCLVHRPCGKGIAITKVIIYTDGESVAEKEVPHCPICGDNFLPASSKEEANF